MGSVVVCALDVGRTGCARIGCVVKLVVGSEEEKLVAGTGVKEVPVKADEPPITGSGEE